MQFWSIACFEEAASGALMKGKRQPGSPGGNASVDPGVLAARTSLAHFCACCGSAR
jgi:hypothetical protein